MVEDVGAKQKVVNFSPFMVSLVERAISQCGLPWLERKSKLGDVTYNFKIAVEPLDGLMTSIGTSWAKTVKAKRLAVASGCAHSRDATAQA